LIVARDAKLISLADSRSLLDQTIEVRKMLRGLLKTVDAALVPSSAE
jgi:hypothetical protein